jgi:hypothetical protein
MKIATIKKNPNNPRLIKDDRFHKLVESISQFPKMMRLRPIILGNDNVVLGGNMRLAALKELKYKEIPDDWVKYADELTEEEKERFIISDNVNFGEWDKALLNSNYNRDDLIKWGMDLDEPIINKVFGGNNEFNEQKCKYPITFFATQEEYSRWENIKESIGIEDDSKALFELMKNTIL